MGIYITVIVGMLLIMLIDMIWVSLNRWSRTFGYITMVGLIFLICTVVGLVYYSTKDNFDTESIKEKEIEISALRDNTNVGGNIFLGLGAIDGVDYYYYMSETSKGKKMEKVKVKDSFIKEVSGNGKATMETYKLKSTSGFVRWYYGKNWFGEEYIFHVPKGTVTPDFIVDMN